MSISDLNALSNVVGLEVKIINIFDSEFVGSIYSYVTSPGSLVLQLPSQNATGSNLHNYKFFRTSHIKHLEVLSSKVDQAKIAKVDVIDPNTLPSIIKKNLDTTDLYSKTRNEKVSAYGQLLFNAIHKTIPEVRWVKESIIILDEIKIEPPYNTNNINFLKTEEDNDEEDNYLVNVIKKNMASVSVSLESQQKGG